MHPTEALKPYSKCHYLAGYFNLKHFSCYLEYTEAFFVMLFAMDDIGGSK